jgi:hypothetical protein
LIAGSNVIFASSKDGAVAIAPSALETLGMEPLPGLQPLAVANGRLYAVSGARIVAFGKPWAQHLRAIQEKRIGTIIQASTAQ